MLPKEARLALFPYRSRRCRAGLFRTLELRTPTLADAAAMECLGCELLEGRLPDGQALVAAWVLSLPAGEAARAANGDMRGARRFMERWGRHIAAVSNMVNVMLEEAFLPFVPAKAEDGGGWRVDDGLPEGYGWPLEMAEALCATYRWSVEKALGTEVQRALALISVARNRRGVPAGGPDYFGRIRLERMRRAGLFAPRADEKKE